VGLTDAMPAKRNPGGRRGDEADIPPDIPRTNDKHARPRILELDPVTGQLPIAKGTGEPIRRLVTYTRPSAMGNYCEDQYGLGKWRAAVALWGAFRAVGQTMRIAVLAIRGYDDKADKQALYGLVDRCQAIADIDHAADHGTALHAIFEQHDKGFDLPYLGQDQPALDAYAEAITAFDIVASETFVVVDQVEGTWIRAGGSFDRLVTPRRPIAITDRNGKVLGVVLPGQLIVVDLKTGSSSDYYGVKYRLQLWLYAHGRRYDPKTGERTPLGARTDFALILHVPAGGDSATWYWVDLRNGIELARTALAVREHRNLGKRSIWPADLDVEPTTEQIVEFAEVAGEHMPLAHAADAAQYAHDLAATTTVEQVDPAVAARERDLAGVRAELEVCRDRYDLGQVYRRWAGVWGPDMQQLVRERASAIGVRLDEARAKAISA
jgi:hypothetical protein